MVFGDYVELNYNIDIDDKTLLNILLIKWLQTVNGMGWNDINGFYSVNSTSYFYSNNKFFICIKLTYHLESLYIKIYFGTCEKQ